VITFILHRFRDIATYWSKILAYPSYISHDDIYYNDFEIAQWRFLGHEFHSKNSDMRIC